MKLGATDYLVKTSSLIDELPIIIVKTLRQITIHRELDTARLQVKEAVERFELAMKTTRDGIWDWDLRNRDAYYSPAYEQMLGFSQELFAHTPQEFISFIHPDEQAGVWEKINSLVSGPADHYLNEFRIRDINGEWHWFLSRATCISRDEQGRALRIIGTHIDITEERKTEKYIHLATKKVHILNNQAGTDLMNQLYTVRGFLSLVSEEETDSQCLHRIHMISTLLDGIEKRISFIQSYETLGISPPEWFNVHIQFIMALSHWKYVENKSDCEHLEILSDPLIEKVFNSLVETTFIHGGEKLSKVRLLIEKRDTDLSIIYEDNGEGISAEDKESIFDFGYGKHQSADLFLTREILDITGIRILENGTEGQGCRFELHIPKECYRYT